MSLRSTLKNLDGHDVRLDIHAFADGQEFNIEIQRTKRGTELRRARYHSSMMDANALPEGMDYKKLPESYVIFITEADVLGKGKQLYLIGRTIEGDGEPFGDGLHIIYVNASIVDGCPSWQSDARFSVRAARGDVLSCSCRAGRSV